MNREMPAPVLAVNNLSISFRHGDSWQKVVRNISFSLYPGKTLAIVGESGSGKSTLLKAGGHRPAGKSPHSACRTAFR